MDPRALQAIVLAAKQAGVDPEAALRVATAEGGIRFGAVGDGGTSFGPFQLHENGALPKGKGADWANSPEGIKYALSQMAASGAKGLKGSAAVSAIVRNFERPADPTGEIQRALSAKIPGFGGIAAQPKGAPARAPMGTRSPVPQGSLLNSVLGSTPDFSSLLSALSARTQALSQGTDINPLTMFQALRSSYGAPTATPKVDKGGSLIPPRTAPAPGSPKGAGLVSLAAKQLGQPYVWGGESRKEGGFDCSGLVDWAMRQQGYNGPRLTTYNIAKLGSSVKGQQLRPGDLVLANHGEHVVIYAGDGKVIAAPHTGTVVQYQPLSKFNITDVRRVF